MLVSPWMGPFPLPARPLLMRLAIRADKIVVRAPAKVNLYLEVLGKHSDNYHEIATLMVAIRLFDTLVFTEEPDLTLMCRRPGLSTGPDNLVIKAARLLRERSGCKRGAHIRLVKRIPLAAGLAGGSSDAAGTLWGLNRLWRLGLSSAELARLGSELGSDVPFFFHTPAAWCTGRGEIVTPLPMGRTLDLVLLCPAFGCPTPEVYRKVIVPAVPHEGTALRQALEVGAIEDVGRHLFNRLQPAAETLAPALASYHRRLADLGPAGQQTERERQYCLRPVSQSRKRSASHRSCAAKRTRILRTRSRCFWFGVARSSFFKGGRASRWTAGPGR